MSQLANNNLPGNLQTPPLAAPKRPFDVLYEPISAELAQVEEILRKELRSDYPFVDQLVKHGFRLGGKRMRPALLLLAAKAAGKVTHDHFVLAAVVEMIHTATLVHDDVLDDATVRRHVDTVNARWNNEASVLLGDFLFSHSFYMASTLETTFACQVIGRATNQTCEGELRQIHSRGKFDLTEPDYLDIIRAKTAELCACSCRLGSHYAGATPEIEESLTRYGRNLGIAFQIVDDLLDVLGDEDTAGKTLGTDLEQQKPTLPVIYLLRQADAEERANLIEILKSPNHTSGNRLQPWLARGEAIAYAREKALWYAEQARVELNGLPAGHVRNTLAALTEFVVDRRA
jgi:octaprenyl-diphosphate synthase